MTSATAKALTLRGVHTLVLALACFALYADNFDHAFHLDSAHVIVSNPYIRSLTNIPAYFVDPGTFTTLRANVDYRPVLQVSYALNYWLGGYEMWWWHFTQILLHLGCVIGLYFLCARVVALGAGGYESVSGTHIAFIAALLFALHPTASGVVNYLSARSSLLTAAFLLPSIVLYMVPAHSEQYGRTPWPAFVLFALALFTKVEAIGCLAVYFLYDVWQQSGRDGRARQFFSDVYRTLNRQTLRRLWPLLGVAVFYLALRQVLLAEFEGGFPAELGPYEYFLTQTVVWWYYVAKWFAPVNLVADYIAFPAHTSVLAGPVLAAIGAWVLVATFVLARWKRQPYLTFLVLSALALLSPTSSIVPLSQIANEHRPYLPLAVLSLAWLIPLGTVVASTSRRNATVAAGYAAGLLIVLASFSVLTWQRNGVFKTEQSFWADIVEKAPSARAYNNLGLTFLQAGDLDTALRHFRTSVERAPYWHISQINLAIVYDKLGDTDLAEDHYAKAIAYDKFTGWALSWRGEYHLGKRMYREALKDFQASLEQSLDAYRNYKGMASAYAGLGAAEESYAHTVKCLELDRDGTLRDIVAIATPFFESPARAPAGLAYFGKLKDRFPDAWWVHANIATLAERLGNSELARTSRATAARLKERTEN